mmetsp:Transcript_12381/g.40751  ORF Transcript_12381/g.40751 Transcript_12381/m.40751 type:complete len:565 (-) Transcript_12381:377-2071(-)|eukprot:CAMPEP_0170133570 /NCGR_PEP_ID=MMETSP0033_2-20121228/1389_1 /TAXON_ID=195969 /ORGANISM="Dolichomastix tenuilepis, Strain CCMP3274" /LENGTH=564 /DNA_ID=CAMNT_0010369069 /DNA_START=17 /DNA_END=1711 /DNA_ORIENTATION=+
MASGEEPGKVPEGYEVITEGTAHILVEKSANEVFYNNAQVVNRDLSVAVLNVLAQKRREEYENGTTPRPKRSRKMAAVRHRSELLKLLWPEGLEDPPPPKPEPTEEEKAAAASAPEEPKPKPPFQEMKIFEGLAASGLRSIRYANEVEDVACIVANDMDPPAVESMRRNLEYNGGYAKEKVTPWEDDARLVMLQHEGLFDVVDLDPYGAPHTLLDSAVQGVAEGGMLLVTATDMAVLCGNNGDVCWTKYGSFAHRAKYCHEAAVRTLLASLEMHANRVKKHIVPVLSVSIDFYVRVFVRVYTSAAKVKASSSKLSHVYQCTGCDSFVTHPVGRINAKTGGSGQPSRSLPNHSPDLGATCSDCGWRWQMGGPIWSDPIHDQEWVTALLEHMEQYHESYEGYGKVHALLTNVSEELTDCPLYVSLHNMTHTLRCSAPPAALFKSALINAGYRVSGSHASPLALKSDAPMEVLWDVFRHWIKDHPVKEISEKTPGQAILAKEPKLQANFCRAAGSTSKAKEEGIARFPVNPEDHWGPKSRAGRAPIDVIVAQATEKQRTKRKREDGE